MIRFKAHARTSLAMALLCLGSGCGPGVGEGPVPADTDTSLSQTDINTETETVSDTPRILCPQVIDENCSGTSLEPIQTVLSAGDFSHPTRFVAMSPDVILATETVDGQERPFAICFDFATDTVSYVTLARLPDIDDAAPPIPVGVISSNTRMLGTPFRRIAILRHDTGYRLYGIPEPGHSNILTALPDLDLTDTAAFPGTVYLSTRTTLAIENYPALDTLCLFGEGLSCLHDGTWTHYLNPDETHITAISVEQRNAAVWVIATKEDGSLVHIDPSDTSTTKTDQFIDGPLTAVAAMPGNLRHTLAGDNGMLIRTDADADPIVCETPLGPVLSINHRLTGNHFTLLTARGEIYDGQIDGDTDGYLCKRNFQTPDLPIMGFPMSAGYFVLTGTTLYGNQPKVIAID